MRERGMIFNAEMVRAVLEGRKTQTRRVVKWRDLKKGLNLNFTGLRVVQQPTGWVIESDTRDSSEWRCEPTPCPFGAVGDRLWVRETARCEWQRSDFKKSTHETGVIYSADGKSQSFRASEQYKMFPRRDRTTSGELAWHPSIHMPRWASRITLEITGVRVERLTALSDEDARNEGCPAQLPHNPEDEHQARTWFLGLWSELYGEESWQANPWVWVIEFKRVEGEHV